MQNEDCQKLRECPFCGGEAELEWEGDSYVISCKECNAEMAFELTRESAIEAWNRRTK